MVTLHYREGMRYVDTHDQMIGPYADDRRNMKWWRFVFWHMDNAAVLNAGVLSTHG